MKPDTPRILLVNPWIHDFAAYDVWAKPLGLLMAASILERHGFCVSYIDCTDRFHPKAPPGDPFNRFGKGPYGKTRLAKPQGLEDVSRRYCRYGICKEWFLGDLKALPAKPDLIFVTSLMTYWYPGVVETIETIRSVYADRPIVLGGIYATLCPEHAGRRSGADRVVSGAGVGDILEVAGEMTAWRPQVRIDADNPDSWPYPAFYLQNRIGYIPLMTSVGCPFDCGYCASRMLHPKRMNRSPESVMAEIQYWHRQYGVVDFVFYDDALLVDSRKHAIPLFEKIAAAGLHLRFHTPNAIHIRGITDRVAKLMAGIGFTTLRLGLETTDFEDRGGLDRKVTQNEFLQAVVCLRKAGFSSNQIGAYLLAGLPGQSIASVEASIVTVKKSGITPIPAYYTPIPGTRFWPRAVKSSRYDLESDPLFTNNAVLPCQKEPFSWESITRLKTLCLP